MPPVEHGSEGTPLFFLLRRVGRAWAKLARERKKEKMGKKKPNKKCSTLILPTHQVLVDDIHTRLSIFSVCVLLQNNLGLFNLNIHAEGLFCALLNKIKGWKLCNANREKRNQPGIDLFDKENQIVVQVTSERSLAKVRKAVKELPKEYSGCTFYFLCFNIVPPPSENWTREDFSAIHSRCSFDPQKNVISILTIVDWVSEIEDEALLKKIDSILSDYVHGNQLMRERDGNEVLTWIATAAPAWKRFHALMGSKDFRKVDRMIDPSCLANYCIIDLSEEIITFRGNNLFDEKLIELLDSLNLVCSNFARTSKIWNHQKLVEFQANAERGIRHIEEILSYLANKVGVKDEIARQLFKDYVCN